MLGEITQYIALAVLLAGLAYFLTLIVGNIKVQSSANISAQADAAYFSTRIGEIMDRREIIKAQDEVSWQGFRKFMVDNQIRPNNIQNNKILELFNSIEKENFIPEKYKDYAYFDDEINFDNNRSYLPNLHIAQLIQSANLKLNEKVLHIGSLTGYVTTILSNLAKEVVAIESAKDLFSTLERNIKKLNLNNVTPINDNYENGYMKNRPYDVIFIDSITEFIPEIFYSQLNDSTGRILLIEKINSNLQKGVIITKNNTSYLKEYIFDSLLKSSPLFKLKEKFKFL